MRIHVQILGIILVGGLFALFAFLLMTSEAVEKLINRMALVPMHTIPEVDRPSTTDGPKTIVWYDVYNNKHGLRNSVSNANFDTCTGIAKNCKILPHIIVNPIQSPSVVDADAVILQGCHMYKMPKPQRRDSNQIFVFAERENWLENAYSKIESRRNSLLYPYRDVFNWTMSYRHDSDILFPYGEVRKASDSVKRKYVHNIYKKKKYDAVWFVSHCGTPSLREQFVREMQKYISVHIYGRCGTFTCPKKMSERDSANDCIQKAAEEYKFVLSFENSYRPNYVTEKLFDWFPRDIIPVVRGGGGDYSKYGVPYGTIIDADKYSSAKELAQDLVVIGSSETKYAQYLHRKHGYYSVSMDDKQREGYCKLCEMLQDAQRYRKSYTHIGAWWDSRLFSDSYTNDYTVVKIYYAVLVFISGMAILFIKLLTRAWSSH